MAVVGRPGKLRIVSKAALTVYRGALRRRICKGERGMKRRVGLGVIADNLTNIGTVLAKRKN